MDIEAEIELEGGMHDLLFQITEHLRMGNREAALKRVRSMQLCATDLRHLLEEK